MQTKREFTNKSFFRSLGLKDVVIFKIIKNLCLRNLIYLKLFKICNRVGIFSRVSKQRPTANFETRLKIGMSSQYRVRIDILIGDTYLIHPISGFISG